MDILIKDYKKKLHDLGPIYSRLIYQKLESSHRIVGIVGTRGVGKTTYILDYLRTNYPGDPQAIYISADDIYFSEHTLLEVAREFVDRYDGKLMCIDEIHRYPNWSQELKNIYDKFSDLKIIFSGSSSIDLIKEKYDLSRRAVLKQLPGLSFREFLEIKLEKSFPVLTLKEIVESATNQSTIDKLSFTPKLLGLFDQYLKGGYYPIFKDHDNLSDIHDALLGIIDKVIFVDIASYYNLKTETLPIFKKILAFIYTSSPSSINVNRIAQSLKKDNSDIARYLELMRDSGLLRFLLIDKHGHALIRNTEKVYLHNPNFFYAIESELEKDMGKGSVRELFALTCLETSGLKPSYSIIGDINCGDYMFEIGGKGKDYKQVVGHDNAFLLLDDIVTGTDRKIPLYLLGFLY